jgi:hypothetical protein
MSHEDVPLNEQDLATLVTGIARDTGTLVHQQIDLLRADLVDQAGRAVRGGVSMAAGGGLVAAGGLMSGLMLVHALHQVTRLPLWLCYGAVGGGLGAAGLSLLRQGRETIAEVQVLPPPETVAALEENVTWVKRQVTPEG